MTTHEPDKAEREVVPCVNTCTYTLSYVLYVLRTNEELIARLIRCIAFAAQALLPKLTASCHLLIRIYCVPSIMHDLQRVHRH